MASNGQGQSWITPIKQENLGRILGQHLAICKNIFKKRSDSLFYYYIDANAGSGYNDEADCEGSPLVFRREVQKARLPFVAYLVEQKAEFCTALNVAIGAKSKMIVIEGDNRQVVPILICGIPRGSYGLLYVDKNGIPDFDLLRQASWMPQIAKIDILIRCPATAIKRSLWQGQSRLEDSIKSINKRYWIVQEPLPESWQWTFFMGLNWDGLRAMKKHGFYYLDSPEGQRIMERLNYTNSEQQSRRQYPLPFMED